MELRVLGPVEAVAEGRRLSLGATKQRAVLAMLALEANRPVSSDRLIEGLWGESPPASAGKNVQLYISQLRKVLRDTDVTITTRGRGYELSCAPDAVDLVRAERLIAAAGNGAGADGEARAALALWRGPPLADVADEPFAAAEIRRCEELWLQARELAIDADLAAGRHDEALRELPALAAEQPLREHLQAQWMLALYRAGRQAEALEAYRIARARLVDAIGAEPGPELRRLHDAMLRQDASLDAPARPRPLATPLRHRARRGPLLIGAGVALAVALAAVAVVAVRDGPGNAVAGSIAENTVALVDPGDRAIRTAYEVGRGPSAVVTGAGSVWIANQLDGTVTRIDRERELITTIDVGPHPTALAFGAGSLWVVSGDDQAIAQVDPVTNRVTRRIPVGGQPAGIAVGFGAVWVTEPRDDLLAQIDLARGEVTRRIAAGAGPTGVATGAGGVWVTAEDSGQLVRVDPGSGIPTASVHVGNGPGAVAVGEGAVWVANRHDGTVSKVDRSGRAVTGTLKLGTEASALAVGDGAVWVADGPGRSIARVDPPTGRIEARMPVATSPTAVAVEDGAVWTTAVAAPASHRGGTLRVESDPCGFMCADPGYNFGQTVEMLTLAYDGLVGYRRAAGTAGQTLVAALATSVPEAQDGGLTYVFTLRPGLRFSDGRPVRSTDFRGSLERSLRISGGSTMFSAIVGAPACVRTPDRCDLSRGVAADDAAQTITLRLSRPDTEILRKLALPMAFVLPSGTPDELDGSAPPAGTGPYRVASIDRQGGGRLVRNRYFESWSADARPDGYADEIVVRRRPKAERRIRAVENGDGDLVALDNGGRPLSPARIDGITTRFPSRVLVAPRLASDFMFLNVREPPFDDVRVRQAVNIATDRRRMVALRDGPGRAEPSCQAVPPSVPAFTPYCPYTVAPTATGTWTAPDLGRARRLIAASGTRGMRVQVWTDTDKVRFGRYFERLLARLGYRTSLRVVKVGFDYFETVGDSRTHAQIGMFGWAADYPAPTTFFDPNFSCAGRLRASPASLNPSQFCSPELEAAVAGAQNADGPAADAAWARAQRMLSALAPAVPLVTVRRTLFTSARAGNVQQNPMWGTLLERVWVR